MATLCIDATNLTEGGGITHLKEILATGDPVSNGFENVIVYASRKTLDKLPDAVWLDKRTHAFLNKGLFARTFYLFFYFTKQLKKDNCDILFNPGGGYSGNFRPYVTMCRNMLVFDSGERARYKFSKIYWRLLLLEVLQRKSLQKANGVIFISGYAKEYVGKKNNLQNTNTTKINHGVSERFYETVKQQKNINEYTENAPFRLLYVSIIDLYKHQWQVVRAVHALRERDGFFVELDLVGPGYKPALEILEHAIKETGSGAYVKYHGNLKYEELHNMYHNTDGFIFASSCENMPNILFEAMNAGLPIACSNRQPMPEFLKDAGWYFDPENDETIYTALKEMLQNTQLRKELAVKASMYAGEYTWEKCAAKTFGFLHQTTARFQR